MSQSIEHGHCSHIGEYVVTKIAIPHLIPIDDQILPSDIESSMSISTEVSSEFFSFSAFSDALTQAKKSLQGTLTHPNRCGIFIRGINVTALEVVAVRTHAKQKDLLDHENLKEQAAVEMALDKHLIASVLPVTQEYATKPAPAEDIVALLKDSHHPDATRKAICTQILGKSVVVDDDQSLCAHTGITGSSVNFPANKDYVISFRIKDVLENGSKAIVILEGTSPDCSLFYNHDLGNREIEIQIKSLDASVIFPICMHLEQPVEAKIRLTLNASARGLSYRGRFMGFTNSTVLGNAIQKKMTRIVDKLL